MRDNIESFDFRFVLTDNPSNPRPTEPRIIVGHRTLFLNYSLLEMKDLRQEQSVHSCRGSLRYGYWKWVDVKIQDSKFHRCKDCK
jgi:hypothetical protein